MDLSFLSFLKKKEVAAFDIGSNSIKLIQLKQTKKGWELVKMGLVELPPEAIVDGSVIDSMTVTNSLKELVAQHNVKATDVVSALTGHSVIIKKVNFATMTEEELAESIQWEAEQYIPFPIAEVNIDFQILGADAEGRGQMDVMLVAVKKDVINDYTNVIKEAGLNPVVIDVDSFAIENMLEINYPPVPNETVAVVNVGASITSISVIFNGQTVFTRAVPMGGNQFTEEIQRQMNISFKDAEAMKLGKAEGEVDKETLKTAIETISTNLSFEVRRSLDFFLGGSHGANINKVYLCGGCAKTEGLLAMMQDKTAMPVEIADPFKNITYSPSDFEEEKLKDLGPYFCVAVGLATRRFGDR